jgi:head-tail adaptor
MIDPGRMNDRITLQIRGTPDPWSGSDGYTDLATVWCQFRPTTGREFREGATPVGEERAVFSIHYRENIGQVDRLVHHGNGGDRHWNIRSIVRVGFKEGLDLHCTAADTGVSA